MPFQLSTLRCRVSRNGTCEDGMEVCLSSLQPASFWPDSDCCISKIMPHIRVQTSLKSEMFAGRCSEKDIVREGQQYGPLDARPGYFTHCHSEFHRWQLKTSCWTKYCLVEAEFQMRIPGHSLNWTRSIWQTATTAASCDCHRQAEDHDCNKEVTFVRALSLH